MKDPKKDFLYGFRGKARHRTNMVFWTATAIVIAYVQFGKMAWCIELAKDVSVLWKIALFMVMLASLAYTDWMIQRRLSNPELSPPPKQLILLDILLAFTFALVTADSRMMFAICTSGVIVLSWLSDSCYQRARRKSAEHTKELKSKLSPEN